jgi:nucleotide-binding universal stress UspA family protein
MYLACSGGIQIGKVLVYFDGTELSLKALRKTEEIIDQELDQIFLLAIIPEVKIEGVEEVDDEQKTELKKALDRQVETLTARGIDVMGLMEFGDIVEIIVNRAEQMEVDLVVIGHEEDEHVSPFTLGSISEQASKRIHRPILIIQ